MALQVTIQQLTATPLPLMRWKRWFGQWWQALTPTDFTGPVPKSAALTLRLTDSQEMQELNRTWRGLDRPTDILSFTALPLPSQTRIYLGDIAIGVPVAQQQALTAGHSLETELAWLASHGLLHLLGWDHQDEPSLERTIQRQLKLLQLIGINFDE